MFLRPIHRLSTVVEWLPKCLGIQSKFYSAHQEVSLAVTPENALIDEQLSVRVSGLKPLQEVTVSATTVQHSGKRNFTFGSFGHFNASLDGRLDLTCDPSMSGTYTGIEPMGLFWSMVQFNGKYGRLVKYDASTPEDYVVYVYPGHIPDVSSMNSDILPIALTLVQRWYKKPNVRRIIVKEGRLRGTLFIPEKGIDGEEHSNYPAIIEMFGIAGTQIESRAALLASRGFVTLSLPYFGCKDLPKSYFEVEFEYFQEAVKWLLNHPSVSSENGIGILGTSLGGSIALYMASHCPEVKAVISINGPQCFYGGSIKHNGVPLPFCSVQCNTNEMDKEVLTITWKIDETKQFDLNENSSAKILFLISGADKIIHPSDYYLWLKKIAPSKIPDVDIIVYPGAGHLIEPPYTPLVQVCCVSILGCPLNYGGERKPHAEVQEKVWLKVQEFLKNYLAPSTKKSNNNESHISKL